MCQSGGLLGSGRNLVKIAQFEVGNPEIEIFVALSGPARGGGGSCPISSNFKRPNLEPETVNAAVEAIRFSSRTARFRWGSAFLVPFLTRCSALPSAMFRVKEANRP